MSVIISFVRILQNVTSNSFRGYYFKEQKDNYISRDLG
jgi:hypothetical protein